MAHARHVSRAIEAALPWPPEPAETPDSFSSSDSLGLLASRSSLLSHDEDRRAVAHAFSWAAPVFLATAGGVFFLLY